MTSNLFMYIKNKLNSKENCLYHHYEELSTDNIKQNHCVTYYEHKNYYDGWSIKEKQINFDDFMKTDTRISNYYDKCKCEVPYCGYNYKPNTDILLKACEKTNIEKNECIEMFDFNKIRGIDKRIALNLTSVCNEKCAMYNAIRSKLDKKKYDENLNVSFRQTTRTQIEKE